MAFAGEKPLWHRLRPIFLTLPPEEHPEDQADQPREEDEQETAQRQRDRALLFRLRPGNAEGSYEALHQEIEQFHNVSQYRPGRNPAAAADAENVAAWSRTGANRTVLAGTTHGHVC